MAKKQQRVAHDDYPTPEDCVRNFLAVFNPGPVWSILDPCAGGHHDVTARGEVVAVPGTYARLLAERFPAAELVTVDIREETPVDHHVDFLRWQPQRLFDLVMSNPPFGLAREFVEHALECVVEGGAVVFLLRLGFLGTQDRHEWFKTFTPAEVWVHSKRPVFRGAADFSEYAHFVWRKGVQVKHPELHWVPTVVTP